MATARRSEDGRGTDDEEGRRPRIQRAQRGRVLVVEPGDDATAGTLRGAFQRASDASAGRGGARSSSAAALCTEPGELAKRVRTGLPGGRGRPVPGQEAGEPGRADARHAATARSSSRARSRARATRPSPRWPVGPAVPTPITPAAPWADAGAPRRRARPARGWIPPGRRWCAPRGRPDASRRIERPSCRPRVSISDRIDGLEARRSSRCPMGRSAFGDALSLCLHGGRRRHPGGNGARVLAPLRAPDGADGLERHDHVEPIAHRSGQPRLVAAAHSVLAGALVTVDRQPAARARVEGRQQHEARGKREDALDARDRDGARVDRATERVERIGTELEGLVQEERAAVRQARFAGPDPRSPADQCLHRDRVVRCPERASQADRGARFGQAGHRMNAAHLGRLTLVEQWQQGGGRPGEQRLADAGRSGEGEVVPAGHRDLERPSRDDLADDRRRGRAHRRAATRVDGAGGPAIRSSSRPARWRVTCLNCRAPRTRMSRTTAPSAALSAGTITSRAPAACAADTSAMTPGTGRSDPSSASSPISAVRPSRVASSWPDATRTPVAMARSWPVPSFGRSAGARLMVMRRDGTSKPELRSAARTRSRASSTALPARPTMVRPGRPKATSTSTRTGHAVDADDRGAERRGEHRWTSAEARTRVRTRCRSPACSPPY